MCACAGRSARTLRQPRRRPHPLRRRTDMIDLSTNYLGLALANPLVASSSPLCRDIDNIRRMEDAGAGAVVLHSLFEEQIDLESRTLDEALTNEAEGYAESPTFFPELPAYDLGPEAYV